MLASVNRNSLSLREKYHLMPVSNSSKLMHTCLSSQPGGRCEAALRFSQRKVRAPEDRVPGNAWEARVYGKCHRKYTASDGKGEKVR